MSTRPPAVGQPNIGSFHIIIIQELLNYESIERRRSGRYWVVTSYKFSLLYTVEEEEEGRKRERERKKRNNVTAHHHCETRAPARPIGPHTLLCTLHVRHARTGTCTKASSIRRRRAKQSTVCGFRCSAVGVSTRGRTESKSCARVCFIPTHVVS